MKMHSRGMRPTMTLAAVCAALLFGGSALAQVPPSGSATTDLIAEVPDTLTAAVAIKAKMIQVLEDWKSASDERVRDFQRECGIAGPTFSVGPQTQECARRLAEDVASTRTAAGSGGGGGSGSGGGSGGGAGGGSGSGGGGADVCAGDIPGSELLKLFTGCPPTTQGTIEYLAGGRPAVVNCGNGQARFEVVMSSVNAVTHTEPIGSTTRTVVDSPAHCAYSLGGAVIPVDIPPAPELPPLPETGFWQEYGWLVTTVAVLAAVGGTIGYLEWRASGVTVLQPGDPPAGGGR